jgi:superfamily II DNA or RNA helicase
MLTRAQLRPYQQRAVQFIKDNDNVALWLDPGLGKTSITLTALADLKRTFDVRRMLVLAPLRVARKVWADELRAWDHLDGLSISCMTGTWAQKFEALKTPADIHTCNRESVSWLEAQFIQGKKQVKRFPWDLVVVDESQSFRSQESKRWKSLNRLRRLVPRMVQLTGTPAPGGLHNLWAQYNLLDGGQRLGYSEDAFLSRFFDLPKRDVRAMPVLKEGSQKLIQERIADITLSMRAKDYLDLPEVLYNPVWVTLPPEKLAKYKELARKFCMDLAGRTITAVNSAVLHGKLLQLANGAIYVDDKGNFELLHDEKIKALMERLEEYEGKPVLIGYSYKSDLKRIGKALDEYCVKGKTWLRLQTDAEFDRWATGTVAYGVLHPASAGHGLNDVYKSGAENLIWFGLPSDLELYQQLNARLTGGHRLIGRNVVVDHLLAEETKDVQTFEVLKRRDVTQNDLMNALVSWL